MEKATAPIDDLMFNTSALSGEQPARNQPETHGDQCYGHDNPAIIDIPKFSYPFCNIHLYKTLYFLKKWFI